MAYIQYWGCLNQVLHCPVAQANSTLKHAHLHALAPQMGLWYARELYFYSQNFSIWIQPLAVMYLHFNKTINNETMKVTIYLFIYNLPSMHGYGIFDCIISMSKVVPFCLVINNTADWIW